MFFRLGLAAGVLTLGAASLLLSVETYRSERALAASRAHQSWGRLEAARSSLEQAVDLAPGDSRLHAELAQVNGMISQYHGSADAAREAIAALIVATRLNPLDAEHSAALGWSYLHLGAYDDAADAFQRALDLDPHNVYFLSAMANLRKRQGRPREAADLYRRALTITSDGEIRKLLDQLERD